LAPLQSIASGAGERASAALARIEELSLRLQHAERRVAELTREATRETLDAGELLQRLERTEQRLTDLGREVGTKLGELGALRERLTRIEGRVVESSKDQLARAGEAAAVLAEAERAGARLTAVLATHHHFDHVGGNPDLLAALPDLHVYGSADDAPRIPGITHRVRDGDPVQVGSFPGRAITIPAHT